MEFIEPYMNLIYLAAIVLALLIFAWILIRAFGGKVRARRGARLGISEYYEVDKSRFLVLIRRDDVEHLVLMGGNQDLVIETNIRPASSTIQPRGAMGRRPLSTEELADIPDLGSPASPATAGPATEGPSLGANVRPIVSRPAPRAPDFGNASTPAQGGRAPNLRTVDRDPE